MSRVYCDFCGEEILIKKLEVKESIIKRRKNQVERCIVQYFSCKNCGVEYVVAVYNDSIKDLINQKDLLLKNAYNMSLDKFVAKRDAIESQMSIEESMLLNLYKQQKSGEN